MTDTIDPLTQKLLDMIDPGIFEDKDDKYLTDFEKILQKCAARVRGYEDFIKDGDQKYFGKPNEFRRVLYRRKANRLHGYQGET